MESIDFTQPTSPRDPSIHGVDQGYPNPTSPPAEEIPTGSNYQHTLIFPNYEGMVPIYPNYVWETRTAESWPSAGDLPQNMMVAHQAAAQQDIQESRQALGQPNEESIEPHQDPPRSNMPSSALEGPNQAPTQYKSERKPRHKKNRIVVHSCKTLLSKHFTNYEEPEEHNWRTVFVHSGEIALSERFTTNAETAEEISALTLYNEAEISQETDLQNLPPNDLRKKPNAKLNRNIETKKININLEPEHFPIPENKDNASYEETERQGSSPAAGGSRHAAADAETLLKEFEVVEQADTPDSENEDVENGILNEQDKIYFEILTKMTKTINNDKASQDNNNVQLNSTKENEKETDSKLRRRRNQKRKKINATTSDSGPKITRKFKLIKKFEAKLKLYKKLENASEKPILDDIPTHEHTSGGAQDGPAVTRKIKLIKEFEEKLKLHK